MPETSKNSIEPSLNILTNVLRTRYAFFLDFFVPFSHYDHAALSLYSGRLTAV